MSFTKNNSKWLIFSLAILITLGSIIYFYIIKHTGNDVDVEDLKLSDIQSAIVSSFWPINHDADEYFVRELTNDEIDAIIKAYNAALYTIRPRDWGTTPNIIISLVVSDTQQVRISDAGEWGFMVSYYEGDRVEMYSIKSDKLQAFFNSLKEELPEFRR